MAKNVDYLKQLTDEFEKFTSSRTEKLEIIPTGSISLDISTEIGGIPKGRISMIYGPYSSGKSTLCLNIAKSAVDRGIKTLYVDAENSFDTAYMDEIVGKLPEELFKMYQPDTAETALEICELGIKSKEFGLVILDSIGSLAPQEEIDKKLTESSMALLPRLLSKFLRRNTYTVRENNVALVLVNQVRSNIGGYSRGYSIPGGNALQHFTSLWIALSRGSHIKQGEDEIGLYCSFVIKKNKLGRPYRANTFPLIFGTGIDKTWNTIEFAEMLGVLQKRGSFYSYEGNTLGQGIVKTRIYLEENPEVLDKIIKECYNLNQRIDYSQLEIFDEEGDEEYETET